MTEEALFLLSRKADGSLRDALSMLDQALVPGASVRLGFPPERCMFFDASGQRLPA